MKTLAFCTIISCLFSLSAIAQSNDMLRGKILFLNSGKEPAVGVKVSGAFNGERDANAEYSASDGSYRLDFIKARAGNRVQLIVGNTDSKGERIEVVNNREIRSFRIPSIATDEFEIIVAKKGERDFVARKYYKIIKTSADRELEKMKRQWVGLLDQQEKNYQVIAELSNKITKLERQTDSLTIYREAFRLASINKDNASDRVKKYLELLDNGESVQEAREVLSIEGAAEDLGEGISQFRAAIEELETRAEASKSLFDYKDAICCYKNIINYLEKMEVDRLEMAGYFTKLAEMLVENTDYKTALDYQQRAIAILEKTPETNVADLAMAYNRSGAIYRGLNQYRKALKTHRKAINMQKEVLDARHPDLAISYNHIALTYQVKGRYKKAMKYHRKAITLREKALGSEHPDLAAAYENAAQTYQLSGQYKKALKYHQKALNIREDIIGAKHHDLGIGYMNTGITYAAMKDFPKAIRFLEKSLMIFKETLPENHSYSKKALQNIGLAYAKNEQFKEAHTAFSAYEKLFPKEGITYRNWVVYHALQNNRGKALENLRQAIDMGYNDLKWLETDDSLDSLRDEKVFRKLLKKLKKNKNQILE